MAGGSDQTCRVNSSHRNTVRQPPVLLHAHMTVNRLYTHTRDYKHTHRTIHTYTGLNTYTQDYKHIHRTIHTYTGL